jgi:hypothetical protein
MTDVRSPRRSPLSSIRVPRADAVQPCAIHEPRSGQAGRRARLPINSVSPRSGLPRASVMMCVMPTTGPACNARASAGCIGIRSSFVVPLRALSWATRMRPSTMWSAAFSRHHRRAGRCRATGQMQAARASQEASGIRIARSLRPSICDRCRADMASNPRRDCLRVLVVVTGNFLHEHHDPAPQRGIINSHERSNQP